MCRFAKIAVQRMMEVLLRLTLQYQRLALCILQAIFEVRASWLHEDFDGKYVHDSPAFSCFHAQPCTGYVRDGGNLRKLGQGSAAPFRHSAERPAMFRSAGGTASMPLHLAPCTGKHIADPLRRAALPHG